MTSSETSTSRRQDLVKFIQKIEKVIGNQQSSFAGTGDINIVKYCIARILMITGGMLRILFLQHSF